MADATPQATTPPGGATQPDRMVWRSDMRKTMRCSSETIRRYLREGLLPELDVDITSKMQGWRLSTLHAAGVRIVCTPDGPAGGPPAPQDQQQEAKHG